MPTDIFVTNSTHTSLSPIRCGFEPNFVNYKKGCTRLAAASDKVYHLLAHGRWFSPDSSSTKTGHQDIAEILLKVALNTINQSIKFNLLDGVLAMTEAEALPYLPSKDLACTLIAYDCFSNPVISATV